MRLLMVAVLLVFSVATRASDEADIRTLLADQQAAWNRGDIAGFMAGYWNSPQLRFAAGGTITYGHAETLAGYQARYHKTALMGRLQFDVLEFNQPSAEQAIVFGRWTLHRELDKPTGLFTLIFKKFPEGWRIVSDHTSSAG